MVTEAQTIFGDQVGLLDKMFSTNESAYEALIQSLEERIVHHTEQYSILSDSLVMQGSNRVTLVKAAHVRGELANTKFLLEELNRVRDNGNNS